MAADPLSLLREYVSTGRIDEVVLGPDGNVDFGGKFTFPKNVATGYKSQQVGGRSWRRGPPSCCRRHCHRLRALRAAAATAWPCSLTCLPSLQGKGAFYDLETLHYFALHLNVKFTEYFKKAREEKGQAVTFVDRKVGGREQAHSIKWVAEPGCRSLIALRCTLLGHCSDC